MNTAWRLRSVILILVGVHLFGTFGFWLIEGWNLLDSLYMTVITISTVGFGETHPLTVQGRAFAIMLILVGVDPIVGGLPAPFVAAVGSLSILRHFESIGRGVIDLRDVLYFAALTAVFFTLAYGAILRRKLPRSSDARRRLALGTGILAVTAILISLVGGHIGGRLDLTPGRSYTLSRASKNVLRSHLWVGIEQEKEEKP